MPVSHFFFAQHLLLRLVTDSDADKTLTCRLQLCLPKVIIHQDLVVAEQVLQPVKRLTVAHVKRTSPSAGVTGREFFPIRTVV